MERLAKLLEAFGALALGTFAPAFVQAVTSWWNRDAAKAAHETAKAQLEAERLRRRADDEP